MSKFACFSFSEPKIMLSELTLLVGDWVERVGVSALYRTGAKTAPQTEYGVSQYMAVPIIDMHRHRYLTLLNCSPKRKLRFKSCLKAAPAPP